MGTGRKSRQSGVTEGMDGWGMGMRKIESWGVEAWRGQGDGGKERGWGGVITHWRQKT